MTDAQGLAPLQRQLVPHITQIGRRKQWGLDEYAAYSDTKLLQAISTALRERLPWDALDVDVVGAMGRSGAPLSVYLVYPDRDLATSTWVLISDPDVGFASNKLQPIKPEGKVRGQNVLLVDSVVKSGYTAYDAAAKVKRGGGRVVGLTAILDYERYPERKGLKMLEDEFDLQPMSLFSFEQPSSPSDVSVDCLRWGNLQPDIS